MPVLVEQFVVVGSDSDARQAAELWRFIPKAFETYYGIRDPAEIQRRAQAEIPIDRILHGWPIGTEPEIHIKAIDRLFDSGATIVNVHAGQSDQKRVIDFYRSQVMPGLKPRPGAARR